MTETGIKQQEICNEIDNKLQELISLCKESGSHPSIEIINENGSCYPYITITKNIMPQR